MKARLERLYKAGRLTKDGILKAVIMGWITEDEANDILGVTDPLDDLVVMALEGGN